MPYCQHRKEETDCTYCTTAACWAIVKDAKGMRESGHDTAVRWARLWLGLDDRAEVYGTRHPYDPEGDVN